jgi:hypothetical protein
MNVVPQIARRSGGWGWFFVWAFLGSAAALSTVSLGPLLLLPVALFGVFLWTRPAVRRSAFGLLTGAGGGPSPLRRVGAARGSRHDLLAYRDWLRL